MEFAKALTTIQEINLGSPALAAGLSGKNRNRLLNRIRRISGKPKVHSGFAEGFIAASILMISLGGLSAAAMISNPTDYDLPVTLSFEEAGGMLSYVNYYQDANSAPDTTEKKKKAYRVQQEQEQNQKQLQYQKQQEKQKQLQYQRQLQEQKTIQEAMKEQQKEIRAAISLEMETIKEKMKAVEEEIKAYAESEDYQEAYKKAMQKREEYEEQMIMAMEAYEKVMEEWQDKSRGTGNWTLPKVYLDDAELHKFGNDSLIWHHYAPNLYFNNDSLHQYYLDVWAENWEGAWDAYEDQMILREGNLLKAYAEMEDLDELLEAAELEVPKFDFDYDYDYDFDHVYDARQHFFMPGSMERIVRDELLEDGLIEHGREYIVLIGTKQMVINGEKQARSVFKKYRRLVESMDKPWSMDDEEVSIHIGR